MNQEQVYSLSTVWKKGFWFLLNDTSGTSYWYSDHEKRDRHDLIVIQSLCSLTQSGVRSHAKALQSPTPFRELMKSLHERLEAIYILRVAVDFGMASIKPFDGTFYFEKIKRGTMEESRAA